MESKSSVHFTLAIPLTITCRRFHWLLKGSRLKDMNVAAGPFCQETRSNLPVQTSFREMRRAALKWGVFLVRKEASIPNESMSPAVGPGQRPWPLLALLTSCSARHTPQIPTRPVALSRNSTRTKHPLGVALFLALRLVSFQRECNA